MLNWLRRKAFTVGGRGVEGHRRLLPLPSNHVAKPALPEEKGTLPRAAKTVEHTQTCHSPTPARATAGNPAAENLDLPKRKRVAGSDLRICAPADVLRRTVNVSDLREPRWWIPVARATGVHLVTITAIDATAVLTHVSAGLALTAGLGFSAILSFGFRGLENLVHGGSHYDICGREGTVLGRSRAAMNDFLCNMTMAIPVAQDVVSFRASHLADHHGGFGRRRDPCRARMLRHPDVQADKLPTVLETLRRVPAEAAAFYRLVGARPCMPVRSLLWHVAVYVAPVGMAFGVGAAVLGWALVVVPLFSVTLPIVRCLAETGEHDYRASSATLSMVERTYRHEGLGNALIHPFGDAYHPEHHLWPDVPQYRLGSVRKRICAAGLSGLFRGRTRILGPATVG